MSDVLLTVRNPDDGTVTPVAGNEYGELRLETPRDVDLSNYAEKTGTTFTGDVYISDTEEGPGLPDYENHGAVRLKQDTTNGCVQVFASSSAYPSNSLINCRAWGVETAQANNMVFRVCCNGDTYIYGRTFITSRNSTWEIVESGGLCHLIAADPGRLNGLADDNDTYPDLRNIPQELTMVEQQLQKVMERLRMAPQAGWEVWDGSDEN